jgi:hypothetical protein
VKWGAFLAVILVDDRSVISGVRPLHRQLHTNTTGFKRYGCMDEHDFICKHIY